ncbi:flagellar basal body P-ring protein FlgI [Thermomonas sp.]|uniref:flagellar basal body P-ring protein FlgI n=1 Tax=Thermomonas sp. TaxID=1971895 RepID=UPI002CB745CD|nr:flagellar basal body P-ring protein FlgI [Thermomonas sp.]HRO63596.1 flagellar basal body P-ring protein FlgI [Thermomonas sp.]
MVILLGMAMSATAIAQSVRPVKLKDLARVAGVRDNPLTGYGLVFGLAGSGDSARNRATLQSVANAMRAYGVNVELSDLASRNVAAVIITAKLPAFAEPGQTLDVQVASAGDARSLSGGTLLLAPLSGPDGRVYAVAQGAISVGGYQFEAPAALQQKNHPTAGVIPAGATVEQAPPVQIGGNGRRLDIVLNQPDFTLANRIVQTLHASLPGIDVQAEHAGRISVHYQTTPGDLVAEIARLENILVEPVRRARVVVNERTGTVVAGGDVRLGQVSVSQGDLRIEIRTQYQVSQPGVVLGSVGDGVRTALVPDSRIQANEEPAPVVNVPEGATVADLVSALRGIRLSTRDVIAVLQSIKAAGALDGELIIQ